MHRAAGLRPESDAALQAGSEEIKDDAWAREGWDGDIQAAKAAEAEQGNAQGEQGKVQLEDVSNMGKGSSKEGEAGKEDKAEGENSGASDTKVADTDQKVLISQSADSAVAKRDPAKDRLQDVDMPAGGQLLAKQGPAQQLHKEKQPGMGKDTSKEGEPGKEDKAEGENSGASDTKVADTDQKVLISQSADSAAARIDPAKDKLQDVDMPESGQLLAKQGAAQQLRKKQPGSEAGSSAANAGGSASSARVSAEVGQPGNWDAQNGQDLAGADAKSAGTQGSIHQVQTTCRITSS